MISGASSTPDKGKEDQWLGVVVRSGGTGMEVVVRPRAYKTFFMLKFSSTQLSTKFIKLINVQMPTTVGMLAFISMINTIV